jgi:CheY-like chemotaxis protein
VITQLLVADSDPFVRERSRGYFGNRGYQVETAADALECLDLLRRIPPDVLVLEWELLWGGGDGVLAYLRENRCRWPETVIATTAPADADLSPRLEAPVKAVLKRPFSMATLFEVIRRAQHSDTQLAARFLRHAQEVAEMEKYRRQWGPPFGPWRPSSFKGGV